MLCRIGGSGGTQKEERSLVAVVPFLDIGDPTAHKGDGPDELPWPGIVDPLDHGRLSDMGAPAHIDLVRFGPEGRRPTTLEDVNLGVTFCHDPTIAEEGLARQGAQSQ